MTARDQAGLDSPIIVPVEAYVSEEYAKQERAKLWQKVWLQAGRVEDLPEVGSFISFEITQDSVLIVRTSETELKAFHNVCPHRGRRLVDVPEGARNASGRKTTFICPYHGWTFNRSGENVHIPHVDDWQGQVESCSSLTPVNLDTWGGWVWINLNPDCESLREFLGVVPDMLDPFQLQNMRARWRKWGVFDCNWKVAMEAFSETYHVATTHPEFNQYGTFRGWSKVHGKHSNIGYEAAKQMDKNQQAKLRVGEGKDPRIATAEMQLFTWEKANTNTTETLVNAAQRLVDELPEGTPSGEVLVHWLTQARRDDAERGVFWPEVDPEHVGKSGTAWQIFPNFQIGHSVNNMLCYNARPYGDDPNKCIFEAAVYQLYPEGGAPETEWQFSPATEDAWCYVLAQDFSNMAAVQMGLQSAGFTGCKLNPYMERSSANLHRNLAEYMGSGHPRLLTDES